MVYFLLHMNPQKMRRIISAILVLTFIATSIATGTVPAGECEASLQRDCPYKLAPQSRFQSGEVRPSDPTAHIRSPHGIANLDTNTDSRSDLPIPDDDRGLAEGTIVGGKYVIHERLGQGGMADVYLASPLKERIRLVVIKIMNRRSAGSRDARERFEREKQAYATIHQGVPYEHIIQMFDEGETRGLPFMVMQYIAGNNLAEVIEEENIEPAEALRITKTIAMALHHAHSKGLIHRDIKPSNILISFGRSVYLTDFGVLKDTIGEDMRLTQTDTVVGTPLYMSPEQADAGRWGVVSERSDVYSLGVVLYEMLTRKRPFEGQSRNEILAKVADGNIEPQWPKKFNKSVWKGKEIRAIALKAMEKDPNKRYQTAKEFADDIENVLSGMPTIARPAGIFGKSIKFVNRHRQPILAGTGILAAILTVTAPFVYRAIKDREGRAVAAQQKAEEEAVKRIAAEKAKAEQERLAAEKKAIRDQAMGPFNNAKALTSDLTTNDLQKYKEILGAAIDHYTISIAIDTEFEDAFYERGRLKHKLGDYAGALVDYAEARRLNKKLLAAYYFAAKIYFFTYGFTDLEAAKALIEEMLRINPDDINPDDDFAVLGKAWILYIDAMENPNQQVSDTEKRVALEEVLGLCEPIRAKGAQTKELYDLLGYAYMALGRLGDALEAFTELIKLDPWSATQYQRRGEVLRRLGRVQAAEQDFNRALQLGGGGQYYFERAQFHAEGFRNENLPGEERERHLRLAIEDFKKAIQGWPNNVVVLREYAKLLIDAKQYEEAIVAIKKAIALTPQDRPLYETLMLAYFQSEGVASSGLDDAFKSYLLLTSLDDLRYFKEILYSRRELTDEDINRLGKWIRVGRFIIPPKLPGIADRIYEEAQQLIARGEMAKAEQHILHGLVVAVTKEQQGKFLEALSQLFNGAVVSNVRGGSLAERSGLIKGDCVLEVNGRRVANKKEFSEAMKGALKTGAPIRLRVRRDGSEREIEITPAIPDEELGIKIAAVQLPQKNAASRNFGGRWMGAALLPLALVVGMSLFTQACEIIPAYTMGERSAEFSKTEENLRTCLPKLEDPLTEDEARREFFGIYSSNEILASRMINKWLFFEESESPIQRQARRANWEWCLQSEISSHIRELSEPNLNGHEGKLYTYEYVVSSLRKMGKRAFRAVPALLGLLEDSSRPALQKECYNALREICTSHELPLLTEALGSSNPEKRAYVALILGELFPQDASAKQALAEDEAASNPEAKNETTEETEQGSVSQQQVEVAPLFGLAVLGAAATSIIAAMILISKWLLGDRKKLSAMLPLILALGPLASQALAADGRTLAQGPAGEPLWLALVVVGAAYAIVLVFNRLERKAQAREIGILVAGLQNPDPDIRSMSARESETLGIKDKGISDNDPYVRRKTASMLRRFGPKASAAIPRLQLRLPPAAPAAPIGVGSRDAFACAL